MAADEPVGKVVCRYPQGTGEMELFPSSEGLLSYGELVFPPDSTSRTLRFEREGYQETLTIRCSKYPANSCGLLPYFTRQSSEFSGPRRWPSSSWAGDVDFRYPRTTYE